ncbi:MAG: hypothetical protein DMG82_24140 [Acidobacteria bacterium]|nr:MAG: hypothetical protein DMG82_24140 [Acidobacteriota bacterium]
MLWFTFFCRAQQIKGGGAGLIGGQGSEIWLLLLPVSGHAFNLAAICGSVEGSPQACRPIPGRIGLEGW